MKIARLPLLMLPLVAIALGALILLFTAMIDQVHLRGAYLVWQENETFAAACVALLAAMYAARPVYMQVRAQSVQAALDLLHRTEADTKFCTDTRQRLFELRRAAVSLAAEIDLYAAAPAPSARDLKDTVGVFMAISPRELSALAERPTITSADRMKMMALGSVLSIAQRVATEIMAEEKAGEIAQDVVARERAFMHVKLAGLFTLSSEIAEDIEEQELVMRDRVQQLRHEADSF